MHLSKEQRRSQGTASKATLASWRAGWGCDCDGSSHLAGGHKPESAHRAIHSIRGHVEALTGHKILSCPWRALYDPLVGEVIDTINLAAENIDALEPDPPAILLDALAVYISARRAVTAHYMAQDNDKRRRELEAARAKNRR